MILTPQLVLPLALTLLNGYFGDCIRNNCPGYDLYVAHWLVEL